MHSQNQVSALQARRHGTIQHRTRLISPCPYHSRPAVVRWSAVPQYSTGLQTEVRPAQVTAEFLRVAYLRAEAYYEEERSRFVGSLKKKFIEQELQSLQLRTGPTYGKGAPQVECLVAVIPHDDSDYDASTSSSGTSDEDDWGVEEEETTGSWQAGGTGTDSQTAGKTDSSFSSDSGGTSGNNGRIVGCIDIKLHKALCGVHPAGVPLEDLYGCYILNVVVDEELRGRGIGKALMQHAMARAVGEWKAERLYTHVAADNEAAYKLYKGCGFSEYSEDLGLAPALKLGRLVLLRATAPAAVMAS